MAGWIDAELTSRKDWADGLASFTLDVPLDFVPGQFTNLRLQLGEETVKRSYSIASASGAPLEFFVARVEGGQLTPPLFQLKPGDRIDVQDRGAGLLTLDKAPEAAKDLWLICTGTGLAPYLSMLRSGVLFPRYERVILVQSARLNAHLAYAEELDKACAAEPRLKLLNYVSRETPQGQAYGGRVTAALRNGTLEQHAGCQFSPEQSYVLLCGNPDMIKEMTDLLGEKSLTRHRFRTPGNITIEKYW